MVREDVNATQNMVPGFIVALAPAYLAIARPSVNKNQPRMCVGRPRDVQVEYFCRARDHDVFPSSSCEGA
jgi:hypothetical protein